MADESHSLKIPRIPYREGLRSEEIIHSRVLRLNPFDEFPVWILGQYLAQRFRHLLMLQLSPSAENFSVTSGQLNWQGQDN